MPVGGVVRAGKIWEEWFVLVGVVGAGSPAGGADDHHVPPGLGGGGPGVEGEEPPGEDTGAHLRRGALATGAEGAGESLWLRPITMVFLLGAAL